ncbi:hypothetical protein ACQP0C_37175 [Nocardia sp. CA-129566]|uniref:hypothetical protein n=1 Tax=Nocardia sp. CA-129566 TaxID=3239976 RepID=UPI003D98AFA7
MTAITQNYYAARAIHLENAKCISSGAMYPLTHDYLRVQLDHATARAFGEKGWPEGE